jgi:SAM-dependent methyltransferase
MKLLRTLFVLLLIAWALATLGFVAWLRERYGRGGPIPVSQAGTLLNPLRRLVMPARETLDFIGVSAGQTVLELGPGPGYYTIEASRLVGGTGRLVCLDLQPGMLDLLAPRLAENGVTNCATVVADATRLPLSDRCVDLAYLITVLGEVPDRPSALAELRRVVKPGGTLAFGESLGDPDYVFQATLRDLCRVLGFEEMACRRDMMGYTMRFRAPGE